MATRPLLMASVLLCAGLGACAPIPHPDSPREEPYEIGDRVELDGLSRRGAPVSVAGEEILVLTFLRPYGERRGEWGSALVERIDGALSVLRADVRARTTAVVGVLPGEGDEGAAIPDLPPHWWVIDGPPETLQRLAGNLGVLTWDGTPELAGQTFLTVVIDRDGRLRHRFPGTVGWSRNDLVGAIVDADGR